MLLTGDIIPYMNGGNAKWRWLLSLCVRWLSPWCVWIMSTEEFIQQNTCKCASNMTEHTASRRNMRFVFCNMSHCISQVETHHRAGWHKGIFCARRGKIHKRCRRLFWTSGLLPQQNINSQPGNTLQLHLILSVFDVYSESFFIFLFCSLKLLFQMSLRMWTWPDGGGPAKNWVWTWTLKSIYILFRPRRVPSLVVDLLFH